MATTSQRKKAGRILTQWHSSGDDPIYAVGSFYVDGRPYPSLHVLERAVSNAEACLRQARSTRDQRDLRFAIRVMKSELNEDEEEWEGGLDSELLDDLVRMEAESMEIDDPSSAHATDEVFEEAERFDESLRDLLLDIVEELPPRDDATARDLYAGNGAYLVLMTLRGEGVGIWDGDWDQFYDEQDLELVEEALKKGLAEYADDTGGGTLTEALRSAAEETAPEGEEEEEEGDDSGSVREELLELIERVSEEHPEAYQQLMMPGAGFPAVPDYAMEDEDSEWWSSERAHQLRDELAELVEEKFVENAPRGTADAAAADELKLMIDSDQRFAIGSPRGMGKAIRENLQRKIKRGTYDSEKAVKAWRNLSDAAAKQIAKEQGQRPWHAHYSVPTRDMVARELSEEFESEWMGG